MGRLGSSTRWTKEIGFRDRVIFGWGLDFAALWRGIKGVNCIPEKGVNPSEIYCIFEGQ